MRLGGLASTIAARCGGRAIPAPDLHLTLAFVGAWPIAAEPRLIDAMRTLAGPNGRTPAPAVEMSRLGSFGRGLVWIAPGADAPWLTDAGADLRETLLAAGIAFDPKPFRPHMTLVRKAHGAAWRDLAPPAQVVGGWTFALGRSIPVTGKPRYRWLRHHHVIGRS